MEEKDLVEIFKSICNQVSGNETVTTGDKEVKIAETINSLDDITENLTAYWNNSIKNLVNNFNNYISDNYRTTDENGKKQIHDAGHSFTNSPYVNPDKNGFTEETLEGTQQCTYESCRTDEIESVLQNGELLDFTAPQNNELDITRLLMPQYARRVEVEDLNRNFWVIGQNLSALNITISKLNNEVLNNLLKEITDLWQNVYRIWEALSYLYNYINEAIENITEPTLPDLQEVNDFSKINVRLSYGYGIEPNYSNLLERYFVEHDAFTITKRSISLFGILPYIKEEIFRDESGNPIGYLYYMPYNQLLTDEKINEGVPDNTELFDETKANDFIYPLSKNYEDKYKNQLVQIDTHISNKKTKEILKLIRSKNFVLVYLSKEKLPYLLSETAFADAHFNFMRFYRDFLYYASDSMIGQPLSQLFVTTETEEVVTTSKTWARVWGLQHIDINENKESYFSEDAINITIPFELKKACEYLKEQYEYPKVIFLQKLIESNDLSELKNKLDETTTDNGKLNETIFSELINDFYILCNYYLGSSNKPSYFDVEPNDNGEYILQNTEEDKQAIQQLIINIKNKDENETTDGVYYSLTKENYMLLKTKLIQWDLISGTFNEELFKGAGFEYLSGPWEEALTDSGFGLNWIYPQEKGQHLYIEFVENAFLKDAIESCSKIGSFTCNHFSNSFKYSDNYNPPNWREDLLYDIDISIPFSTPANIKYEDFVRMGKPYPNIKDFFLEDFNQIQNIDGKQTVSENYYNNFLNKKYLTVTDATLTIDIASYIPEYYDTMIKNGIAIDGFWGQNAKKYEEKVDNLALTHPPVFYFNTLQYGIASSDLIDSNQDSKAQTRRNNCVPTVNPNLNLRFLKGNHNYQEIEIVLTKDKVNLFIVPNEGPIDKPTAPIVTLIQTAFVKIGDFYPYKEDNSKTMEQMLILNDTFDSKGTGYDIVTYGLGSYHITRTDWLNSQSGTINNKKIYGLKYIDYNNFMSSKNLNASSQYIYCFDEIDKGGDENSIKTMPILTENAINYCNNIISGEYYGKENSQSFNYADYLKNKLIITKVGKEAWEGTTSPTSGSQWSKAVLTHLLYTIENEALALCVLNKEDGYFDIANATTIDEYKRCFSEPNGITRFRHLVMSLASKYTISRVSGTYDGEPYDGYLIPRGLAGYIFYFDRNQKGLWNSKGPAVNQYVANDKIKNPSFRGKWNTLFVGETSEEQDQAFQLFVKKAFLQTEDQTIIDNYTTYERLVAYAPFEILFDLEIPEGDPEKIKERNEKIVELQGEKISTYLYIPKDCNYLMSEFVVQDGYTKIRYNYFSDYQYNNNEFIDMYIRDEKGNFERNTSIFENIGNSLLSNLRINENTNETTPETAVPRGGNDKTICSYFVVSNKEENK